MFPRNCITCFLRNSTVDNSGGGDLTVDAGGTVNIEGLFNNTYINRSVLMCD